jgi:hypothetical protein
MAMKTTLNERASPQSQPAQGTTSAHGRVGDRADRRNREFVKSPGGVASYPP